MNGISEMGRSVVTPYLPIQPVTSDAPTAAKELTGKPVSQKVTALPVAAVEQKPESQSFQPSTERAFDRYVPEEPPTHIGAYRPVTDEDGNRRIVWDREAEPMSDSAAAPEASSKAEPTSDEKAVSSCTVNTDKVEAEIQRLKKKQAKLEQQLAQADERQQANLERQLAQVEAELRLKDNDAYRKQHAVVTEHT